MSLPAGVVKGIATTAQMRDTVIYWSALGIVVAVLLGVYLLLRSRYGLALTAIRDSEPASASLGVDNYRIKLVVYVVTAAGTGLVGALIFLSKLRISPDAAFSVNDWTAFVIFIVVIGGVGRIEGPILGTALFFLLRELFADLGSWYLILLGAIAVAIMLKAPHGIWGLLADRYDLQLFPLQRRVHLVDRGRIIGGDRSCTSWFSRPIGRAVREYGRRTVRDTASTFVIRASIRSAFGSVARR
jgi:branched-chain amino acid transport system permease protein